MQFTFDTYGFKSENLDEIAQKIELALSIKLEARYSSYAGAYYYFGAERLGEQIYKEELRLHHNYWKNEESWDVPDFREYPSILRIQGTTRAAEFEQILLTQMPNQIFLLHRDVDEA